MGRMIFLALLILCLTSTAVYAGGAGDCITPIRTTSKHFGVGAAFEYNYVHSRMNNLENSRGPRGMELKNTNQVYGKGIIGLGNYVNLYGKIGGANYDLNFVDKAQDATMSIKLRDGVYTGAGINALFPLTEVQPVKIGLGFDIQSNLSLNSVKEITRSDQNGTNPAGKFYRVDGQNSLYMTCRYDMEKYNSFVVGYIGGYQSWAVVGTYKGLTYTTLDAGYIDKEHYQGAYDFTSFGVMVGADIDIAKYVSINIEGRFVGETALTTGATIKF